jgi:hypothetical protein
MGWRINRNASRAFAHWVAIIGIGCMATTAIAAPLTADANRKGYDYAIRCYVAGAVAVDDKRINPDGTLTASLKGSSRRAFDAAHGMGKLLGLSRKRVSDDLDAYGRVETITMVRDDAYFQKTRNDCTKLGLM